MGGRLRRTMGWFWDCVGGSQEQTKQRRLEELTGRQLRRRGSYETLENPLAEDPCKAVPSYLLVLTSVRNHGLASNPAGIANQLS